ncbi:MAG TPA: site-specific DNA-methyltransferase [Nitrososphaera sp.]
MVDGDNKEKLVKLLTAIFQFDAEDLDFGIYRILNFKKREIKEFLNRELIEEINRQLKVLRSEELRKQELELDKLKKQLVDLGVQDYENNAKYREKKKQLENVRVSAELENEIYNHIYTFFSRYYDRGDFIGKKRYGSKEKYAIPYNGEEVLLHWANDDQYYVKSGESFRRFSFVVSGLKVNFRVVEAEEENGGAKAEENKYFIVSRNRVYGWAGSNELDIYFDYRALTDAEKAKYSRPDQERIDDQNLRAIQESLEKESRARELLKQDERGNTPISKNLRKYTRKNSSDYFIHKDLKGFLERELDFYIKNEVVDLSDVTQLNVEHFNRYILEIKVIRTICNRIIDFLSQIENFQKKIWEKRKFVLRTDYCITLDYIDEKYYPEILKNKDQLEEWKKLYGFEIKEAVKKLKGTLNGHGGNSIDEVRVLKNNPTLMIDTKFFDPEFKLELIEDIGVSDEKTNGILIKSENFQALNLLSAKYKEKIKCIHIDPPYNTATSGFLYKNNYQHSSWLSMMKDRVKLGIDLLQADGSFLCHIDENEYERLHLLLEKFPLPDAGTIVWDKRNPMNAGRGVATQHEYIICRSGWDEPIYLNSGNASAMLEAAASIIKKHGGVTEAARKEYAKWVSDNDRLSGGEKAYRYLDNEGKVYQSVSLRAPEPRTDPKFFRPLIHPVTKKPCPVPPNGFSRTPETLQDMIKNNEILFGPDETTQPRQKVLLTPESKRQISSVIQDAHKGKADVALLGLDFPYCHPVSLYRDLLGAVANSPNDIVIDYFAGSGTTAHAILELNKEDKGNRKFILVESGPYFDTVTKPRVLKVIYSRNWRDGKPLDNDDGIHKQIIKYQYLEQYEDALENIEFTQKKLGEFSDYFVKYMLDFETKDSSAFLNIDKMKNPFNYRINIIEDYQSREVAVDMVETYNYLIGLEVEKIRLFVNNQDKNRRYVVVEGKQGDRTVVVIWRNVEDIDIEGDKNFIQKNILVKQFDEVHINGDSLVKNAILIEEQFKQLMIGIQL